MRITTYLLPLFICLQLSAGIAQNNSPYQLHWKKELPILLGGTVILGTGTIVAGQVDPLTVEAIDNLDASSINEFDRKAADNWSPSADEASDYFLFGAFATTFSLALDKKVRSEIGKVAVLFAESFILSQGLTTLTKGTVKRSRPFLYNPDVDILEKQSSTSRFSFYSGHTGTVAVLCFFSAKVFSDYHPESKWKPVIWTAALTAPAITGYLRVKAGKHFPTDVITGYIVSGAIGYLIPQIHKTTADQNMSLQVVPGLNGPGFAFSYKW